MSFSSIRDIKASRKARVCEECRHPINIGDPYTSYAGMYEGEFYNGDAHTDCLKWANRVMCMDDGRGCIIDSDPADEGEDELDEAVRANPPPAAVYARLPARWRTAIDAILGPAPPTPTSTEKG